MSGTVLSLALTQGSGMMASALAQGERFTAAMSIILKAREFWVRVGASLVASIFIYMGFAASVQYCFPRSVRVSAGVWAQRRRRRWRRCGCAIYL